MKHFDDTPSEVSVNTNNTGNDILHGEFGTTKLPSPTPQPAEHMTSRLSYSFEIAEQPEIASSACVATVFDANYLKLRDGGIWDLRHLPVFESEADAQMLIGQREPHIVTLVDKDPEEESRFDEELDELDDGSEEDREADIFDFEGEAGDLSLKEGGTNNVTGESDSLLASHPMESISNHIPERCSPRRLTQSMQLGTRSATSVKQGSLDNQVFSTGAGLEDGMISTPRELELQTGEWITALQSLVKGKRKLDHQV